MNRISIVIPLAKNSRISFINSIKKQNNKIKTIIEYGNNPSRNRNNGVKRAKTEFIGFINGHTILAEDWSKKLLDFFSKHKNIDIVGGPQLTPKGDKVFARISGYALSSIFGAWKISNRYSGKKINLNADETMISSANLICRKAVFKKIRFDEKIYPGEDPKFISDAKKKGFGVAYSPDIITYNERRSTWGELAKQIYNYGATRPMKESIFETLNRPFFLIPSIFLLYLGLLIILAMADKLNFIISIPLLVYIILNLGFTIANAYLNRDITSLFVLPFVYPTIHLSYGFGFLASTIKKLFWGK